MTNSPRSLELLGSLAIRWRKPAVICLLLAALTLVLYWPATHCDFVNYDDPVYVTANYHVQGGLTLVGLEWALFEPNSSYGYWHPVTLLSHMIDCQIYGLNPWGHHLTNILFHAANAALLFILLWKLTGATWRSALVAALFAFHPLHVESAAWVAERKDLLSAFFGLATLICYVRYVEEVGGNQAGSRRWYWLSFGLFVPGLLSKPMLVTWPFLMLVLDWWPLGRIPNFEFRVSNSKSGAHESATRNSALLFEKIPFFALVLAVSIVTYAMSRVGGAMGSDPLTLPGRLGNALVAYCRYLGKLFWPAHLAVFYPHPGFWPLFEVLLAGACLIGISAAVFALRGRWPFLLAGWLWFVGTLVPVIGVVQVGDYALADRFSYLPSIGVFLMVVWGAFAVWEKCRLPGSAAFAPAALALAACAAGTRGQLQYWSNTETLFNHDLAVVGNNATAHDTLGYYYFLKGRPDEAIAQYQKALRIDPGYYKSYDNLGFALFTRGDVDGALANYVRALKLKPRFPNCLNNLGTALMSRHDYSNAIAAYDAALKLNPDFVDARVNLGLAFFTTGNYGSAMKECWAVLNVMPNNARAHNNLANALVARGDVNEAIVHYWAAVKADPGFVEPLYNLGYVLSANGQYTDAINCYERALKLKPGDAQLNCDLGDAMAGAGRTNEAVQCYEAALRLRPDLSAAQAGLKAVTQTGGNAPPQKSN